MLRRFDDGDKIVAGFGCAWIIGALCSAGVAIAIIWAIVKLVAKYG